LLLTLRNGRLFAQYAGTQFGPVFNTLLLVVCACVICLTSRVLRELNHGELPRPPKQMDKSMRFIGSNFRKKLTLWYAIGMLGKKIHHMLERKMQTKSAAGKLRRVCPLTAMHPKIAAGKIQLFAHRGHTVWYDSGVRG